MDGGASFLETEKLGGLRDAMQTAIAVFGGRRIWKGDVHGLVGLIRRQFTIYSNGLVDGPDLVFEERLDFSDGPVERRHWRIREAGTGLVISAPGVSSVAPGSLEDDALVFVYDIKFGAFRFRYRDEFRLLPDGGVANTGLARLLGVPIMRIRANSGPARLDIPVSREEAPGESEVERAWQE